MGTPSFAVPSLKILLENNHEISSVVTAPDKKKGRGQYVSFSEIKEFALKNNLKILQPEKLRDKGFEDVIFTLSPELIIVVAFRILPKEIFTIPKFGSFNLHASLLPKYRGAAPINRALINGEKETGVTSFFLQEKVDTGNIILQKKIQIDDNDDAGSLHDKLSQLGAEAVLETVKVIQNGNVELQSQDDSLASPAFKIFKEDCIINWDKDAVTINNFIRGLSPYPAAFTYLENKSVKIYKAIVTDVSLNELPGKIIIKDKRLLTASKDFLIEILEMQLEGRKRMNAIDFINGLDKNRELRFTTHLQ